MATDHISLRTARTLDRMLAARNLAGIGVSALLSHALLLAAAVLASVGLGGDVTARWIPGTIQQNVVHWYGFDSFSGVLMGSALVLIIGALVGRAFSRSKLGWPELALLSALVAIPWFRGGVPFLFNGEPVYGLLFAPVLAWLAGLWLVWALVSRRGVTP